MADRDDTEHPALDQENGIDEGAGDPAKDGDADGDIVRRHLTRAWQSWAPSPDLDARVRARLTSSSAATMGALGLGAATGTGRPGPLASLRASGKLGALVGAGLLGVGFLSGYLAHSSPSADSSPSFGPRPAPPAAVSAPAPQALVAPPADTPPMRADEPSSKAPPRPSAAQARSARAAIPSALAARGATPAPNEELALLQRAERAVRADNAALALALIGELEARYPRSALLEERSAIELLAHCRAGASDAGTRAARFLRQHPSSLYAGRIRELCATEPSNGPAEPSAEALTKPASPGHGSAQKEPL